MAGRLFEYASSPESSPLRLIGPKCAVLAQHRTSSVQPRTNTPKAAKVAHSELSTFSDVDDNDSDQESLSEDVTSVPRSQIRHPRPAVQNGTAKKRRHMRCSEGHPSPAELLQQLDVVERLTSGFHNNCLWFSTRLAMGELIGSMQYSYAAEQASEMGRTEIHRELVRMLPEGDKDAEGLSDSWWAGYRRCELERIYQEEDMMSEPHLYALANLLQRSIIVVDTPLGRA